MKNEIIEEAKKVYQKALQDNIELSFYDGVNLGSECQAKIMYSEEEVLNLLHKRFFDLKFKKDTRTTKEWFEQFKKK
jgi:DNA polymerase III delta prime subunit